MTLVQTLFFGWHWVIVFYGLFKNFSEFRSDFFFFFWMILGYYFFIFFNSLFLSFSDLRSEFVFWMTLGYYFFVCFLVFLNILETFVLDFSGWHWVNIFFFFSKWSLFRRIFSSPLLSSCGSYLPFFYSSHPHILNQIVKDPPEMKGEREKKRKNVF